MSASPHHADSGKDLALRTGEGFTIELEELSSAGYTWQTRLEPEGVLQLENSTRAARADSGAGGAMVRTMTFCAIAPGTVKVSLALRRPWEKEGEPARTFQLNVVASK